MLKTVVTSFTEKGYNLYGKNFIESFKRHWKGVNLVVYYEGDKLLEPDWHYIDEVEGLSDWMDSISKFPMMSGDMGDGTYNIQLDARMVRKPFIQAHACNTYGGKVFWVDADVFTFADVPETFLDDVLPDDKFCCHLGRDGWEFPDYTESGFLGFNTEHPLYQSFFGAYMAVFKSGLVFTFDSWHDCYGFDAARHHFKAPEQFVNLAAHIKPDVTNHPFVNSVLGQYMDHRKGPRKQSRTEQSDLVIKRDEPYWSKPIILPVEMKKPNIESGSKW